MSQSKIAILKLNGNLKDKFIQVCKEILNKVQEIVHYINH